MDDPLEFELQPLRRAGSGRPRPRLRVIGLVAAVVVAVLGGLVATGTVHLGRGPFFGDRPARIAVVDDAGGLSTMAADGTAVRAYPIPGVTFQFPAWSPDGSQVAAIGQDPPGGAIFAVNDDPVDGKASAPTVVYRDRAAIPIYLYWSPDGRRISFLTSLPDTLALEVVSPAGVAPDGIRPAAIVQRGQPLYWDWIDSGHMLVHTGGDAAGALVGEVGVEAPEADTATAPGGPFQTPAVSAGGRYRAHVVAGDGSSASVVVEARDGFVRHEATVLGSSAIGWSPAGDQLAYTAPRQSIDVRIGALRLMDAASGATRPLLDGLVVAFFWAPDGRTIAAIRLVLPGDQNVAAVEGIASIGGLPAAQGGSASLRLAFVDVATGAVRSERTVSLSELVVDQLLPYYDQYALSHRLWSSRSDAIVLPLVDDGGVAHITIVPADGSEPRQIAEGVAAFWSP